MQSQHTDFKSERARLVAQLSGEIRDKDVLTAMARVPREAFVTLKTRHIAYEDRPLPIGQGQTISQPLIVAMMTEALGLDGHERVLEIGTGSGYQTALLAELAHQVVTVERLTGLAEHARLTLDSLGYQNIEYHLAEETLGWRSGAPYDAILVSAAAPRIPAELVEQLAMGGKMVIPVGSRYLQEIYKVTRLADRNEVQQLGACRFVSLIGKSAWEEQEV